MKRAAWLLLVVLGALSSNAHAQKGPKGKKKPPVEEVVPPPVLGQTVTLTEALGVAVKSNYTLATSQLDVSIDQANLDATRGVDDFIFDANANFRASKNPQRPGSLVVDQGSYSVDLGAALTKPLPSGGSLKLDASFSYARQDFLFTVGGVAQDDPAVNTFTPSFTLTLFQPLLRGRGRTTARSNQSRARAATTVAEKRAEAAVSNVIRDVVQAYWEVAYATREVEIRKQSLALAQEQLRITRARLDVGVGAPTDVAAVEQGVASREEELLVAELAVSERALALRRLAGMEVSPASMDLVAADKLEAQFATPPLEQALEAAIARNPDIQVVQAQGAQAQIEVDVNENGVMPQLDLTASLGTSGVGDKFGNQFDAIGKGDAYNAQVGLVFSTPIGNHSARGALESARRSMRKVRVNEADIKQQISVAVVQAINVLRSTQKRVETLEKSTRLAQVNLDAEKARFEVGRTTNFEVLRRQEELAQSQLRQARAAADYLRGVATLEALTGDILAKHSIKVSPK